MQDHGANGAGEKGKKLPQKYKSFRRPKSVKAEVKGWLIKRLIFHSIW